MKFRGKPRSPSFRIPNYPFAVNGKSVRGGAAGDENSGAATRFPRDATHRTVLHRATTYALEPRAILREMAPPSTDPTENLVTPGVAAEESREARLRRDATNVNKLHMTERECSQSL
eukprot:4355981-Pleurochrysis_carterae.AAC.3